MDGFPLENPPVVITNINDNYFSQHKDAFDDKFDNLKIFGIRYEPPKGGNKNGHLFVQFETPEAAKEFMNERFTSKVLCSQIMDTQLFAQPEKFSHLKKYGYPGKDPQMGGLNAYNTSLSRSKDKTYDSTQPKRLGYRADRTGPGKEKTRLEGFKEHRSVPKASRTLNPSKKSRQECVKSARADENQQERNNYKNETTTTNISLENVKPLNEKEGVGSDVLQTSQKKAMTPSFYVNKMPSDMKDDMKDDPLLSLAKPKPKPVANLNLDKNRQEDNSVIVTDIRSFDGNNQDTQVNEESSEGETECGMDDI